MRRVYNPYIQEYLHRKIMLITGPRQAGKTYLSKELMHDHQYLSFDDEDDRSVLREKGWDRKKSTIIFDELHKMKN